MFDTGRKIFRNPAFPKKPLLDPALSRTFIPEDNAMHRRTERLGSLALTLLAGAHSHAAGMVITDPAFFDAIPHTLIDFETRSDGTPVDLAEGSRQSMRFGEYSPLGVAIFGDPNWVNFTSDDLEAVQGAYASLDNALALGAVSPGSPVGIGFLTTGTVRAFSIFIMMSVSTPTPRPEFDIFSGDTFFTTIVFDESLVQGRVGDIEFGFVGYASEEPFDAVIMRNYTRPAFDDLRFSAIPAPGAGAAFGLLGLGALARRRR